MPAKTKSTIASNNSRICVVGLGERGCEIIRELAGEKLAVLLAAAACGRGNLVKSMASRRCNISRLSDARLAGKFERPVLSKVEGLWAGCRVVLMAGEPAAKRWETLLPKLAENVREHGLRVAGIFIRPMRCEGDDKAISYDLSTAAFAEASDLVVTVDKEAYLALRDGGTLLNANRLAVRTAADCATTLALELRNRGTDSANEWKDSFPQTGFGSGPGYVLGCSGRADSLPGALRSALRSSFVASGLAALSDRARLTAVLGKGARASELDETYAMLKRATLPDAAVSTSIIVRRGFKRAALCSVCFRVPRRHNENREYVSDAIGDIAIPTFLRQHQDTSARQFGTLKKKNAASSRNQPACRASRGFAVPAILRRKYRRSA